MDREGRWVPSVLPIQAGVEEEAGGRSRVVSCLCVPGDPGTGSLPVARRALPRVLGCAPAASGTGGTPHHLSFLGGL